MRLQRYSQEQIDTMNVMPDGIYDAEVVEFHDTDKFNQPLVSKKGNAMSKIKLNVWDMNGAIHEVYDYLVDVQGMAFKGRHFCEAIGMIEKYDAEEEIKSIDILGKRIKVVIGNQVGEMKPDGTQYPTKNVVKDYVKPLQLVDKSPARDALPFDDDLDIKL